MTRKSVDSLNEVAGAAAGDVFEAIHAVMHVFRSEQYRVLHGGPHDLTHLEGKILGYCARRPGATLSELVVHFARDKGQLARLTQGLKKSGLLSATTDPSDRRSQKLQLTRAGRAVHESLQRQLTHLTKLAGRQVSAEERAQLVRLLTKLRTSLEPRPVPARGPTTG